MLSRALGGNKTSVGAGSVTEQRMAAARPANHRLVDRFCRKPWPCTATAAATAAATTAAATITVAAATAAVLECKDVLDEQGQTASGFRVGRL